MNKSSTNHTQKYSPELLGLFLGLHETSRLPPQYGWEFLSIRDWISLRLVSKRIRRGLAQIEYTKCRDGKDYLVPFPGFPGVLSTQQDAELGAGLFQHQLASLQAMYRMENPPPENCHFGALRGGILGDAPGLGKTITMLSLIASAAGVRPVPPVEFWGGDTNNTTDGGDGWNALRINPAGREHILKALKPIRNWVQQVFLPQSKFTRVFQQTQAYVSPPYIDSRFPTIRDFERYVIRQLRHFVPQGVLELFRQQVVDIRAGLDKRNRKLLKSPEGRRLVYERRLVSCSATLVVVPDALLEHWHQQIQRHVRLDIFADEKEQVTANSRIRGVVHLDGVGDLADICETKVLGQIHQPVLPTWELSKFLIVLTTFSRCQSEYQRTSTGQKRSRDDRSPSATSPLLQMRWLRVVVDEGHELGTHEAGNSVTHFINQVAAERRWVLSGTPTTGNEDDKNYNVKALDQLQRLLYFLRHPTYGTSEFSSAKRSKNDLDEDDLQQRRKNHAKSAWAKAVKDPFLKKRVTGRMELLRVLKEIMVLHRKEDIQLPKPVFRQIETNAQIPHEVEAELRSMTYQEQKVSYLEKYLHTEEFQSLVDQTQAKYIISSIQKARRQLLERGGLLQSNSVLAQPIAEFEHMDSTKDLRPIKAVVYSSEKNILLSVTEQLIRELGHEPIAEMYDSPNIGDISTELTRFRYGFREHRVCPICNHQNDTRKRGRTGDRCKNLLLEVVSREGTRYLIEPERITRTLSVPLERMGVEPLSNYPLHPKFWRVGDMLQVDVRDPHPTLVKRKHEDYWTSVGAKNCVALAEKDDFFGPDWYFGPLPEGETEVQLVKWQICGRFHNHSRWYKGPRLADAPVEKTNEDVHLLSLDAGLSHGLDLSFVTHLFLLEPIDDAALLEQVTSRAHRLGATGPVNVETINVFYELSKDLHEAMQDAITSTKSGDILSSAENSKAKKATVIQDRKKTLSIIVCQYCYRKFNSWGAATEHEQTLCPRNPANKDAVDPFHLSSVYREIRPPPPLSASENS